jgi:transcriptional regulator with XRE-family HTH domain
MTQESLGFEAGIQRKHVSSLELGEKQPSLTTIFALARALRTRPGRFIGLVEKELTQLS